MNSTSTYKNPSNVMEDSLVGAGGDGSCYIFNDNNWKSKLVDNLLVGGKRLSKHFRFLYNILVLVPASMFQTLV